MTTFHFGGAYCTLIAYQIAVGNAQLLEIYKTGIEKTNNGIVKTTRNECIGRILGYMIEAVPAFVAAGMYLGDLRPKFTDPEKGRQARLLTALWFLGLLFILTRKRDVERAMTLSNLICIYLVDRLDSLL